jgi:hypothetical protein
MARKPKQTVAVSEPKMIVYMKFLTTDEIIGEYAGDGEGTIIIKNPMMMVYPQDTVILTPFALFAQSRTFTFPLSHVSFFESVDDVMAKYYETSLEFSKDHKGRFDLIISKIINNIERKILDDKTDEINRPTNNDLNEIEKEEENENLKEESPGVRRNRLADNLVKLAEAKGLGKKKVVDDKQTKEKK